MISAFENLGTNGNKTAEHTAGLSSVSPTAGIASSRADGAVVTGAVARLSSALLFEIPPSDANEFAALPWPVQKETRTVLELLRQIHAARKKQPACKRLAALMQNRRGFSAARLYARYYEFLRNPDWRALVNRAKAKDDAEKLPAAFIEFWKKLCEDNQRVCSEAHRELLTIWRTHYATDGALYKSIPGYGEVWPEADGGSAQHPAGWGQRNLYRYTPDKLELAAARIGITAASGVGLKLRFKRTGLKLGQFVQFDDHEFDLKVNLPGQLRSLRPRCFGAADVLTSCCFAFVAKPTFYDEDEQKKRVLTERDFMWFVVSVLTDHGYRADCGTMFCVEHGTAAIRGNKALPIESPLRDDLEKRIFDATAGMVRVARGGRYHHTAHGGQFAAPSGGNFRFKAIIENYWRLINDRLAGLTGQVGKDRLHAPEENERADAYNNRLLKAATGLPVEKAAQLILPRLTWDEFVMLTFEKFSAINDELNHKIKHWERCGFVLKEWREQVNDEWRTEARLLELPEAQRHQVLQLVGASDSLVRVRRMTRWEAFQKHASELTRLDHAAIPALVGRHNALNNGEPLTVRNGCFEFRDWRVGPDACVFLAVDERGQRLREGEKFIGYVNPMSPRALIACDAAGRVVSVCPPMPEPALTDAAGVKHSLGLKKTWYHRALAGQRARHETDAAGIAFMKRHNAAVLAGSPVTATERKAVAENSSLADEADDALDTLFNNQPTNEENT